MYTYPLQYAQQYVLFRLRRTLIITQLFGFINTFADFFMKATHLFLLFMRFSTLRKKVAEDAAKICNPLLRNHGSCAII